eukprot:4327621-Amphidinium_carterae.1
MLAWSYATLLAQQRGIFDFLSNKSLVLLPKFNAQDLSNTVWAFATAGESSPELLAAIGDE